MKSGIRRRSGAGSFPTATAPSTPGPGSWRCRRSGSSTGAGWSIPECWSPGSSPGSRHLAGVSPWRSLCPSSLPFSSSSLDSASGSSDPGGGTGMDTAGQPEGTWDPMAQPQESPPERSTELDPATSLFLGKLRAASRAHPTAPT